MKHGLIFLLLFIVILGCATVDPSLQLSKGTEVAIIDATEDVLYSSSVARDDNAVKGITRRIIKNTKDKLSEYNIGAYLQDSEGLAKIKYDIKTMSNKLRIVGLHVRTNIEIKYRVTFESPDGRKLFVYDDEESDNDIDDLCEHIAKKIGKRVKRYIKQ